MTLLVLAIACLLAVTLGYTGVCAAQPFATCRHCHGFGFATTTDRKGRPKRGKTCRRCKGHGIHIRRGRHAYNIARGIHRDGTR
jgi:DnaJ-class molecular chaperone